MGLRDKLLSGFLWTGLGTIGNGIISLLVTVFLARLLTPEDFALIALLTIFVSVSNIIVDSGFSQAIIRDDKVSETDLSSVFWFNLVLSFSFYVILFFSSNFIATFYNEPQLINLSRVVFLVIIFNAFIIIQNATLKRNLDFVTIEKSSVLGALLAGVISVLMAFTGFGIWALVANMVLMPFFRGILLWTFSKWRPKLLFSFDSIKKYFGFGGFLMLQGLIDVIMTNINSILIGKVYTKADLGYYSQGGKLNTYIVTPLEVVMDKVLYPVFSKLKNEPEKLKEGYRKTISTVLFIMFPVLMFVICNPESTITFFFGEKWAPAAVYLQLISILALFQLVHKAFMNVVLIKGKTKNLLYFAIIKQTLRLIALLITVRISVFAMAFGFCLSGIIGSILYICLGMYYLKYNFIEIIKDNLKTIIITMLSLIVIYFIPLPFIIQAMIMVITYSIFSVLTKHQSLREVLQLIKKK